MTAIRFRVVAEYEFDVDNGFQLRAIRQRFNEAVGNVIPCLSWNGQMAIPGKLVNLATERTGSFVKDRTEFKP